MFILEIPISNTNRALNIRDFVGRILGYYAKPTKVELQDSLEHSYSCAPCYGREDSLVDDVNLNIYWVNRTNRGFLVENLFNEYI